LDLHLRAGQAASEVIDLNTHISPFSTTARLTHNFLDVQKRHMSCRLKIELSWETVHDYGTNF